jgi:hypothetical protein
MAILPTPVAMSRSLGLSSLANTVPLGRQKKRSVLPFASTSPVCLSVCLSVLSQHPIPSLLNSTQEALRRAVGWGHEDINWRRVASLPQVRGDRIFTMLWEPLAEAKKMGSESSSSSSVDKDGLLGRPAIEPNQDSQLCKRCEERCFPCSLCELTEWKEAVRYTPPPSSL